MGRLFDGLIGWSIGYLIGSLLPAPADGLLLLALFVFGIFLASEVTAERMRPGPREFRAR